jgi:DNA polymerase III sliding clamp (beta) subunit (PCNA family)
MNDNLSTNEQSSTQLLPLLTDEQINNIVNSVCDAITRMCDALNHVCEKISSCISDERIIITSNTRLGSVREEIASQMTGNRLEISYNPKYFIDALRVIDDEQIEIYFSASPGACTIRPVEGDEFAYIILPLRG